MPTVLRVGPYRLFFYAGDREEPVHIHIQRDDNVAKFWLEPIRLQSSGGFRRQELNEIQRIIAENKQQLVDSWHDYFGN